MSTVPTMPSTPSAGVSPQTETKSLRSGGELTEIEADALSRQFSSRLIILAGPPNSGKTTLVARIYEMVRKPRGNVPLFAWSKSLIAFEQRCHLSRVASGLPEGTSERTPNSDEQRFYHLRLCDKELLTGSVDLLFFDLVGERFNQLRVSFDECKRVTTLSHANFLVVLLDGKRIESPAKRHLAVEECINFLQSCADSKMSLAGCHVQIAVTKFDRLSSIGNATAIEAVMEPIRKQVSQRLARRFSTIEFIDVAALPEGQSPYAAGYGIDRLLATWIKKAVAESSPVIIVPNEPNQRELEAFAARQLAGAKS